MSPEAGPPSATATESHAAPTGGGVAFLLAQLGSAAAQRFAERVSELDLTPPETGLLRAISREPGSSQRELATRLGLFPSRLVTFVDDLESRGLVRRERKPTDRRQYAVHLTDAGQALMRQVGRIARDHEREMCRSLDETERARLGALLGRIAEQEGLAPGVHPGFRRLGGEPSTE